MHECGSFMDFLLLLLFTYIFILAALGLCCCARAFPSCSEWGSLSSWGLWASQQSGFSLHSTGYKACRLQQLWHPGLVVLKYVKFSLTRDQTHVLCIGRWILNQWTTREILSWIFSHGLDEDNAKCPLFLTAMLLQ